jgi:hypothetical protein
VGHIIADGDIVDDTALNESENEDNGVDDGIPDGIAEALMELGCDDEEIPVQYRKSWTQLFKYFNTLPGVRVSNEAWTILLRAVQKHKPTLTEDDLKEMPKTGRGITYLSKVLYDRMLFRDLTEYCEEDDMFTTDDTCHEDFEKWHKDENVEDLLLSISDHDYSSDDEHHLQDQEEEEKGEEENNNDDESFPNEAESQDEDQQADDEDSDKGEDDNPFKGVEIERDIERDLLNDMENADDNIDGWFDQSTCYLGIENVLMGRNPGIVDIRGYENVLKVMATLNHNSLSDEIVDMLWDQTKESSNSSQQVGIQTTTCLAV